MTQQRRQQLISSLFRRSNTKMLDGNNMRLDGEIVNLLEFIKDRLYFVTLSTKKTPKDTDDTEYFSIDRDLVYANFLGDFGPLHVGNLYRYFCKVKSKLDSVPRTKRIVHFTTYDPHKRSNAAFLIATFAVLFLNKTPKQAYQMLLVNNDKPFLPFQDAASPNSIYQLSLLECLEGILKAHQSGFVRFNDFDVLEYDYYSAIKHGDINWIVPRKLLAHSGPVAVELNTPYRPPEYYVPYFLELGVTVIIRLNTRAYDPGCFKKVGIDHKELFFSDGSCPPALVLEQFLKVCEETPGVIAVHCKAGLGRTGSLIGAYIMKHYRMRAKDAIAWMRIARPGCVIGKQQSWLEEIEIAMWIAGDAFRKEHYGDKNHMPFHQYGINSITERKMLGIRRLDYPKMTIKPVRWVRKPEITEVDGSLQVEPGSQRTDSTSASPITYKSRAHPKHPTRSSVPSHTAAAGPSLPDRSSRKSPSDGSINSTKAQKGRKKVIVGGKVATTHNTEEVVKLVEETQGDKLRRAKAAREKLYSPPKQNRSPTNVGPPNV